MFMWMNTDEYAGKGESCLDSKTQALVLLEVISATNESVA